MKPKTQMITRRYLPARLSRKDRRIQSAILKKSRRLYKRGVYFTRKPLSSYKSKTSKHILNARKLYHVKTVAPSAELAKKTGCSVEALAKIVNKGEGAYFSSGSRPNQTGASWGIARLASAVTGGKAAAVDYSILENGCAANSIALRLAKGAVRKHGHGTRRVPKTQLK